MLKLLKKYLKGYRFITVLGPLFKLFEALIELFIPRLVANIVDVGIKNSDKAYVWKYSLIMLGLYAVAFLCSIICQYFAAKSAYGFGTNLRKGLYNHINHLPLAGIDHFQTPTLVMRINLDVVNAQNALNRFTRLITRAPFMLIGALIMAVIINPTLSLVFFGAALLLTAALFLVMAKSAPRLRKINLSHDEITLLSRENLSGARVVRAFDKQAEEEADFRRASNLLKRQSIGLSLVSALSSPLTYLIVNLAAVFIVYIGAFKVENGAIEQGEIIALTNYLTYILNAMLVLALLVTLFTKAAASTRRINDVFAYPTEDLSGDDIPQSTDSNDSFGRSTAPDINFDDSCKTAILDCEINNGAVNNNADSPSDNALVFENVSMAYSSNAGCSLKNISFSLKRGGTLGIIGSTGSGKTTLISLISKLYDYDGRIEFFGRDLSDLSAVSVRNAVSVAPQKAVLFTGTVRDNLLMANPSATDKDIAAALSSAQCSFISSAGAMVTRGGQNYSGGQRQRLCIARALIKKPRLLILDDSTSALDYSTEAEVKRALRSFLGLTKIIVSQRAISIKNADLIIVLEEGEAVGVGTHAALYDSCPVYREIVDIQGVTL